MFEKAIEFVSANWGWFVILPIVGWAAIWYIYSISGKNKSWHKY